MLGVATVVCCVAGVAGDMAQDWKVGHNLGGTPWRMEVGESLSGFARNAEQFRARGGVSTYFADTTSIAFFLDVGGQDTYWGDLENDTHWLDPPDSPNWNDRNFSVGVDRAEGHGGQPPSQEAKAILRIATPVLKFRATRDGRRVTGDAMEMRGGIGYVEEWANPRLVRDAHLGSIWEGAGNVVAIDVVQRAIRRHACHEPFIAAVRAKLDDASDVPDAHRNALREVLENAGRHRAVQQLPHG